MSRSCEEDPAFDYLLMLFLDVDRRAADGPADAPRRRAGSATCRRHALVERARRAVRRASADVAADELRATVRGRRAGAPAAPAGSGSGRGAAGLVLTARREAFEPLLPDGGEAAARARRDAARRRARAARRDRRRRGRGRRRRLHEVGRRGDRARRSGDRRRRSPRSSSSRRRSPSIAAVAAPATSCPRSRPTSIRRP